MADPFETQHRVVETIQVKGVKEAQDAFNKIAKLSDDAAKALGHTKEGTEQLSFGFSKVSQVAKKAEKPLADPPKKAATAWTKLGGSMKSIAGTIVGQFALFKFLEGAVMGAFNAVTNFIRGGWEINTAYEAAQSRIKGTLVGLLDFKKGTTAFEKVAIAQRGSNVLMDEFREISMEAVTPLASVESAYTRINTVLAGLGMNQKQIVGTTKETAAAARVYGENVDQAGSIVAKAIFEGTVEGETAFARALKAQAQVTSKMKVEKRLEKVMKVLHQMGAPIAAVTRDTGSAMQKWQILSSDVLQRVTVPLFQKIGEVANDILDVFSANKGKIDEIVIGAEEVWATVFNWGTAVWDTWKALDSVFGISKAVVGTFDQAWKKFRLVWKFVDLAASGVQILVEAVMTLIDPTRGFGKLNLLSESIHLKWLEISKSVVGVITSFSRMALPDWVKKKVPGVQKFFDEMGGVSKDLEHQIASSAKRVREFEKALGVGPTTESTRALAKAEAGVGLDKDARDALLKSMKGLKINQNIASVTVNQDLRGEDPDRVLIEFTTGLERIGEAALQSSAGGAATAFEGGGF